MCEINLYHSNDCPLCDDALALIYDALPSVRLSKINIATDKSLMVRYGMRIPVVRHEKTGRELNWPFDVEMLKVLAELK